MMLAQRKKHTNCQSKSLLYLLLADWPDLVSDFSHHPHPFAYIYLSVKDASLVTISWSPLAPETSSLSGKQSYLAAIVLPNVSLPAAARGPAQEIDTPFSLPICPTDRFDTEFYFSPNLKFILNFYLLNSLK